MYPIKKVKILRRSAKNLPVAKPNFTFPDLVIILILKTFWPIVAWSLLDHCNDQYNQAGIIGINARGIEIMSESIILAPNLDPNDASLYSFITPLSLMIISLGFSLYSTIFLELLLFFFKSFIFSVSIVNVIFL